MTDKQIIIDGVDVSGCPSIQSNNIGDVVCVRLARTSLYCKGQPCYYKALERKEQECEELKEAQKNSRCAWKSFEGTFCPETQQQLDQLKAENDELKTKLINWLGKEGLRQSEKEFYEQQLEAYKMEAEEGKEINAELKAENEVLKQYKASKQASYEEIQRRWNEVEQENRQLKSENKHLNDLLNQALKDYEKARETLTEIKEIAEKMKNISENDGGELTECFFIDKQCEKCSDEKCLPYWFKQILQKISEVEDGFHS